MEYNPRPITREQLPAEFRPLTAWNYFWLQVLFAIPVVGFVFLIVFSCSGANINRRSFARSYFCYFILVLIIAAVVIGIAVATGGVAALTDSLSSLG